MKCPHCLDSFFPDWKSWNIFQNPNDPDNKKFWAIRFSICPSCSRTIVGIAGRFAPQSIEHFHLVYPKILSRAPIPHEVPEEFTQDYKEACLVLSDSPKASAALSRRALQHILRAKGQTTKKDLFDQIQEVLGSKSLPLYLSRSLDAVRQIGNFAAHPTKSKSTGEIVDVEVGEAVWNLDVVEGLFDYYFVQEKVIEEKKKRLNQKLKDAGKPELL